MERQPTTLARKGEQTRERIFQTALALFVAKGYESTTMRDIAAEAECSLGLTYRYFAGKEQLVLELYRRLVRDLEAEARQLPRASLADRFYDVMKVRLAQIAPYREVMGALLSSALNPRSAVAVLGDNTGDIRNSVRNVFAAVVTGASDAPKARLADDLTGLLYAAHLATILYWIHDRTPDAQATEDLLVLERDMLARLRPVLRLPPVARLLNRLARTISPVLRSDL